MTVRPIAWQSRAGDSSVLESIGRPVAAASASICAARFAVHNVAFASTNHKAAQARLLAELCSAAGLTDPEQAAAEITFLLEGTEVTAQNDSIDHIGERLVRMVAAALERPST